MKLERNHSFMKYTNITARSHTHTHTDRDRDRDREVQNLQQPINLRELENLLKKHFKKTNSIQGNTKQGEEDYSTSSTQEHKNILSTPYHNVIMIDFLYTPAQSIPIWAIIL